MLRLFAVAGALVLCRWGELPWPAIALFALLGLNALIAPLARGRAQAWSLSAIWLTTVLIPFVTVVAAPEHFPLASYLDPYFAIVAWLLAAALWPSPSRFNPIAATGATPSASKSALLRRLLAAPTRWKLPALAWLLVGTVLWVAGAYAQDIYGPFYAGLGITIGVSLLCLAWFRLPLLLIQAILTLMLLCIGLPIAEIIAHPPDHIPKDPHILKQYSNYALARKRPAAFEAWWNCFWNQWLDLSRAVIVLDPKGPIHLHLRPNSHGTLIDSHISINSRGFRGAEIPAEKGNTYRIVALGESTTFGFTINAQDRPWPEMLQQFIRERLNLSRPVEVINAGIPSADLPLNLSRFPAQILPLHPDMIICYHGFNCFHLLDSALPRASGKPPPAYHERPLRLLADCEYRLKLMLYRRAHTAGLVAHHPTFSNLMNSKLARAYSELIRIAQTNHIRLVLANFSMAANESSPEEQIEFFRPRTPAPYWVVKANMANTQLVRRLAEQHPEVTFVDTHPHLDGQPGQFLDLIHFLHPGEVQMAENVFEGIEPLLERELGLEPRQAVSELQNAPHG